MRQNAPQIDAGGAAAGSLIRRLDAAAAWINPFLMAIATMLLIVDLRTGSSPASCRAL